MNSLFMPRRWTPSIVIVFALGLALGFAISQLKLINFTTLETRNSIPNKITEKTLIQMSRDKELNSSLAKELLLEMEEIEARKMSEDVRVLCWVMTSPENHEEKAVHVKATWGRHCNKLIFISDEDDESLPALKLPGVRPGRDGLWSKTVAAFKYVHENCSDEYDWVLKADDDTYVVVENLRKMLLPYSPKDPLYFGFRIKNPNMPEGYMSGGAGYVLSKEAVRRVVMEAFDGKQEDCELSTVDAFYEDFNIAGCLYTVGVEVGESRDALGRNRFFPFDPEWHTHPHNDLKDWWYGDYIWWPSDETVDNCSDEVISFHYMDKFKLYMMEYLVYHVRPFGVRHFKKYDNYEK